MNGRANVRPNAVGLMVLHLALALPLAYFLNIWADEASTLYTTENGFDFAWQIAASHERQAPLYFWILSLWRSVEGSIFFARIFSVICSLAAIWVIARIAGRLFERRSALLITAFFALHPFLLWASVEIRVYSLVILLTAVLLDLFLRYAEVEKSKPKSLAIFTITAIAGIYTNYYLGFLLVGFFAVLLLMRRWNQAATYLASMAAVGLCISPLLLLISAQLGANTSGFQEPRSVVEGIRYLWHHSLTFLLPTEVFPDQHSSTVDSTRRWFVIIFAAAAALLCITSRKYLSTRTLQLFVITLVTFCFLLAAYFLLGGIYIEIRHAAVVFVPLVCFVASLIDDLAGRLKGVPAQLLLGAGSLVVMASFTYGHLTLFPGMAKRGDWARVAAFIQENESPGQPILIFPVYDTLALPYHYRGKNRILPDERLNDFSLETEFGTATSLADQTRFLISKLPADTDQFWLAVHEICLTTEACLPLENYLMENYTIEKEQQFYLEKVFLLRRKAK